MESVFVRVVPDTNQVYLPGSRRFYSHANHRSVGPKGTHEQGKIALKIPVRQQESGSFVNQKGVRSYNFKIPRFDPRAIDKFVPRSGNVMRVVGIDNTEDPISFVDFSGNAQELPFTMSNRATATTGNISSDGNPTIRRTVTGSSTDKTTTIESITPESTPSPPPPPDSTVAPPVPNAVVGNSFMDLAGQYLQQFMQSRPNQPENAVNAPLDGMQIDTPTIVENAATAMTEPSPADSAASSAYTTVSPATPVEGLSPQEPPIRQQQQQQLLVERYPDYADCFIKSGERIDKNMSGAKADKLISGLNIPVPEGKLSHKQKLEIIESWFASTTHSM